MKFEISSDLRKLVDVLHEMSRNASAQEAAKALNSTVTFVKKEVSAEVSGRTGISKALLKRRMKTIKRERASFKRLRAVGTIGGKYISVGELSPKPRRAGRGVIYKTIAGQQIDPNAFYAKLKNGKKSAWVRKGKARLPIKEKRIKIRPHMLRAARRVIRRGGPAHAFFEKKLIANLEKRLAKEIAKRGLKSR